MAMVDDEFMVNLVSYICVYGSVGRILIHWTLYSQQDKADTVEELLAYSNTREAVYVQSPN